MAPSGVARNGFGDTVRGPPALGITADVGGLVRGWLRGSPVGAGLGAGGRCSAVGTNRDHHNAKIPTRVSSLALIDSRSILERRRFITSVYSYVNPV